jgi:hypothetical protein
MFSFSLFKCGKTKKRSSRKSRKSRRVKRHRGGGCPPGVDTESCRENGFSPMIGGKKRRLSRRLKGGTVSTDNPDHCVGSTCEGEDTPKSSFMTMFGGKKQQRKQQSRKGGKNNRRK